MTWWDEMDRTWWDEVRTWESKTIRLSVNGYPVGWIKENFPRPKKRRNRTW